jgi:hypothetical protein
VTVRPYDKERTSASRGPGASRILILLYRRSPGRLILTAKKLYGTDRHAEDNAITTQAACVSVSAV